MRGSAGGDPNRQTTLPSGRGVCLISSSCPGSLTAATGSDLAGRRLQQCALRTVPAAPCSAREAVALGATPSITSVTQRDRSSSFGCISPSTTYRLALPAPPRGGGRRRGAPGGGGSFEGWPCVTPPCEERGAAARRDEHSPADDDRRGSSRSWSSENPNRRRRPGRRHDWREVRLAEWSGSGTERSARRRGPRPTGGSVVCRWRVQTRGFTIGTSSLWSSSIEKRSGRPAPAYRRAQSHRRSQQVV